VIAKFSVEEASVAAAAQIERNGVVEHKDGTLGARAGFDGIYTDTRKPIANALFVALSGERFDGSAFAEAAAREGAGGVLVSREHAARVSAIFAEERLHASVLSCADPGRALLGLARAWRGRMHGLRAVAITGSAGKTSTKELVASVLGAEGSTLKTEGNLNNEIGVPQTLLSLNREHKFAVVECGMNHLGEIARLCAAVDPDVGVITNIGPVHLEGCGSIEGVAHAKGEMFHGLRASGIAVANLDDARVLEQAKLSGRKLLTFGAGAAADVRLLSAKHGDHGLEVEFSLRGRIERAQLQLIGLHNGANACAAAAAGVALGLSNDTIVRGLSQARTPGRRMRPVRLPNGALLIDDCYNANPSSMRAAFETVAMLRRDGGAAILVLGDMLELGPTELALHRETGEAAAAMKPSLLVAFGERARSIAEGARAKGLPESVTILVTDKSDPDAAVRAVQAHLKPSDIVLVKGSRGMQMERISDPLAGITQAATSGAH
jgi:UDP-N-acetylmuramoyl-tripeptide--D-alanyl-D-alanine ligase